ncbi:MAG TPA: hypothetical protein PLG15_03720 [Candidatus Gastranaerophilaceae bacterium]|nr:hypothetical protein [Candidatus Gastranaerophilaceae bacterium]HPT41473.1 hypothetical protein [Candidatus Gastranaerophilaceae bacterium]
MINDINFCSNQPFVKYRPHHGAFNPKDVHPMDIVRVDNYEKAMNGEQNHYFSAIALTYPDRKGNVKVLDLKNPYSPEVKNINIYNKFDDKIEAKLGNLDLIA